MIKYLSKHLSKSNMDFYFYNESYPVRYKNKLFHMYNEERLVLVFACSLIP